MSQSSLPCNHVHIFRILNASQSEGCALQYILAGYCFEICMCIIVFRSVCAALFSDLYVWLERWQRWVFVTMSCILFVQKRWTYKNEMLAAGFLSSTLRPISPTCKHGWRFIKAKYVDATMRVANYSYKGGGSKPPRCLQQDPHAGHPSTQHLITDSRKPIMSLHLRKWHTSFELYISRHVYLSKRLLEKQSLILQSRPLFHHNMVPASPRCVHTFPNTHTPGTSLTEVLVRLWRHHPNLWQSGAPGNLARVAFSSMQAAWQSKMKSSWASAYRSFNSSECSSDLLTSKQSLLLWPCIFVGTFIKHSM